MQLQNEKRFSTYAHENRASKDKKCLFCRKSTKKIVSFHQKYLCKSFIKKLNDLLTEL